MFTTLMLAVLAIYFGEFLRKIFPILKKILFTCISCWRNNICIIITTTIGACKRCIGTGIERHSCREQHSDRGFCRRSKGL